MLRSASHEPAAEPRPTLRQRLLAQRDQFVAGPAAHGAGTALTRELTRVLTELEPGLLGVYWPLGSEFNAATLLAGDATLAKLPIALPFAQRSPVRMHYRAWDGRTPSVIDECGIPSASGAPVRPDVVLVPCVGFTPAGIRLGYGGGFFDRWLALHPDVTSVGVAWAVGEIDAGSFEAQPHDIALTLIVTERGVV